jgi:gamma-glutamyltranspeptidase
MAAEYGKRLRRRGHDVARVGPWEGSGLVQAILIQAELGRGRVYFGATDPRGEGQAIGL